MKLAELLNIETPTLAELEQTAALLEAAIEKASEDIVALNAEDRGKALDRIRGTDTGAEERAAAIAKAQADRSDAAEVLVVVQFNIAAENERAAKEAEGRAWQDVRGHLARRRATMAEIQQLSEKIAGLFDEVMKSYNAALVAAPRKPQRPWQTPGHRGHYVGAAILADLHSRLGSPLAELRINPAHLETYERSMRPDGLVSYLNPTEALVLRGENVAGENMAGENVAGEDVIEDVVEAVPAEPEAKAA